MSRLIGILLAAGASTRFGADKLTQPMPDGEWVAVRACLNLLSAVDRVIAVVRPGAHELSLRLAATGAKVLECAVAEQGMGCSLAFAIANSPDADGWVVALADMPWISSATINRVAEAVTDGAHIAAPSWRGQRGHPVGFANVLAAKLLELSGDRGARSVIETNAYLVTLIETNDVGVIKDIDRPQDLQFTS
jgi:molybdenum cofactor cytidylyltransferase